MTGPDIDDENRALLTSDPRYDIAWSECIPAGPNACHDDCDGCYCHMVGGDCRHCSRVGAEAERLGLL